MSCYTDDAVLLRGVAQTESHFIAKPFSPQALLSKVREVLEQVSNSPGREPGAVRER
jgi:DNA-binding response OmpR family regulator